MEVYMHFVIEKETGKEKEGIIKISTTINGENTYAIGFSIAEAVGILTMKHNLIPDLKVTYK
jgi:hypothetical protein